MKKPKKKTKERGIYFDGWYRDNHCYHPSLPYRSRQMIEDIEAYEGTLLVWSAMGGGSISLPYLEHEAFGEVDPRMRFYGYMNDSEFIKECGKRGIKVFGIVFEVQGWEFPAVIGQDKDGKPVMKEFNVQADNQTPPEEWYGLREFTQDKHWELFGKKLADYYPDGLFNSDGEPVTDLWEECCARTYEGTPVHSDWVEVKSHNQIAYQMCRNNPVWRDYLKKIMEIQIDAGVQGIQLDESELPMTSIGAGGCFCKDCMKEFRAYLKGLKAEGKLCGALTGVDLDTFDYGKYIVENKLEYPVYYEEVPLYKYYWDYQLRHIKKYFKELVDHAKAYSLRTRGDEVLVSGNFFNVMPSYFALEPYVDVIITEMKNTLFRQPAWYRFASGFAGEKPIIVAENPYGGIVPELLEMVKDGRGYDLYRIFLLEASVYGCNMAVPYGGWMGNTIKDAFYPPKAVTAEIQCFLSGNERLFSGVSDADVGVVYSYPSYYWREAVAGYSNNVVSNADNDLLSYNNEDMDSPNSARLPFWEALRILSDKQICYDAVMSADGVLREDNFSLSDISGYQLIILADNTVMTERQLSTLLAYLKEGGRVLVFGRLAENLPALAKQILSHANTVYCENPADKQTAMQSFGDAVDAAYIRTFSLSASRLGVQTHLTPEGTKAFHLLNYDYDKQTDMVTPIPSLTLELRGYAELVGTYSPGGKTVDAACVQETDKTVIILRDVPAYVVLEIKQ